MVNRLVSLLATPCDEPTRRRLLRELPLMLGLNCVFAAAWSVLTDTGYGQSLVFSQCIGLLCYAGMRPMPITLHPALKLAWALAAAIAGIAGGQFIAALILGIPLEAMFSLQSGMWAMSVPFSSVAFALAFGFFAWRTHTEREAAQLAARAAEAEAGRLAAEHAASRAQLAALQAQIEPHFLFNTLANLRSLIGRDPELARTLLDRLIEWLRVALTSARAGHTTLGAEADLLAAYLDIQQIRMGGRLSYGLEIPAALRGQALPPLLLQPLVENAVKHGMEPKIGPSRVVLSACEASGALVIRVEDDGVGLDVAGTPGHGMGLAHVRERLSAHYGADASLSLCGRAGGGTLAEVRLPLAQPAETD